MPTNRQILLRSRPNGAPTAANFDLVESPMPEPGEGEVLLRHRYLSLDPYMRGRMSDAKSYSAPVPVGGVMEGQSLGVVVASRDPTFKEGDKALGGQGWQAYSVVKGKKLIRIDDDAVPFSANLGVLGMTGLTAWTGLEDIGKPKPGETVVVSAASGAVGQVVGQIAKLRGARVVGIAGGAEKCRFVTEELGFDACLDHRGDLGTQLDAACPDGIDVYWENVGGAVQAAVFPRLNNFGRMVMCGMIAQYNEAPGADASGAPVGPNLGPVVRKRLHIQGFIVSDTGWPRYAQFRQDMLGWIAEGKIKWREDVVKGLEKAPEAFMGLLTGKNFGKLVVELSAD